MLVLAEGGMKSSERRAATTLVPAVTTDRSGAQNYLDGDRST